MDIFDDFSGIERRAEGFRLSAKRAAPGVPVEQVVPGALVMLSACKATGDRSYTNDIFEVLATNAGFAVVRETGLIEKPWRNTPISVALYEREFYPAEHIAEVVRSKSEGHSDV